MSASPKAFLLHGFLGAGKTTLAKRLEQEQKAVRFTHDEWVSRLYGDDPPMEHFQEYARRISEVMEGTWTRCLEVGTPVVLDFGFWSRSLRTHVRTLVSAHRGEAVLYRLNCPDEIAWKRIALRNDRLAGSLHIDPNMFRVLKAGFEPLGLDEPRIEFDPLEA